MTKNDMYHALELSVSYKRFLEDRGYVFEEISIKPSEEDSLEYDAKSRRYLIKISDPLGVLHAMTCIVLQKDGVVSVEYPDPVYGTLGRDLPPGHLFYFDAILQWGVVDYYADSLLFQFSKELAMADKQEYGELSNWVGDYFSKKSCDMDQLVSYLHQSSKEIKQSKGFPPVAINCFEIGSRLFYWYCGHKIGWFTKRKDFKEVVAKLNQDNKYSPDLFSRRCQLIKRFVDSLPDYDTIKERSKKSPVPIANRSIRLFNMLYYGVDMDYEKEVGAFIRDGKTLPYELFFAQYGFSPYVIYTDFNECILALATTMKLGYDAFVRDNITKGVTRFSPVLV